MKVSMGGREGKKEEGKEGRREGGKYNVFRGMTENKPGQRRGQRNS